MVNIEQFESHGRTLLVEFKCRRCKKTEIRKFEYALKDSSEYFRGLYDLKPPAGWQDGGFNYPLFCPDCKTAYERFMNNEDVERRERDGKTSS